MSHAAFVATAPGYARKTGNVSPGERSARPLRQLCPTTISSMKPLTEAVKLFSIAYLRSLLAATGGNVTQAASRAGRNRTEFYRLLNRLKIDPNEFRFPPESEP